ncbi:MAG: hypothetical protein GY953_49750 [bacterium]|nr:hypothetical protein [bacterium]
MKLSLGMNPYLFGCLVLMGLWAITWFVVRMKMSREDLQELWWASLSCSVLGITEPLFVPEYWTPPSVLSFYRWDLESFIFCFAVGGIASVATEISWMKRFALWLDYLVWRVVRAFFAVVHYVAQGRPPTGVFIVSYSPLRQPATSSLLKVENMLLVTAFAAMLGATAQFGLNIIYDSAIVCLACAVFITWRRPELRWQVLGGGITFTVIYTVVLTITGLVYPDFYVKHWQLERLSGIWIADAPLEEYIFAFSFGIFWTPMYEVWKGSE